MAINDNMNKPAPLWFRRLETALIFLFMGAIPLVTLMKGISPDLKNDISLVILPGLTLFVKAIGIFFMGEVPPADDKKP